MAHCPELPFDGPARRFPAGFAHHERHLDPARQSRLVAEVLRAVDRAGWFQPTMPRSGAPMSVRMCNLGPPGWVTDAERGYRYQGFHPVTGRPWPPLPDDLLQLWSELTEYPAPPEACLVNLYRDAARMGLHQDKDEQDFSAPVLSVSLGDDALFRIGGSARRAPTQALTLRSGDVVVLGGEARLCFHGIDRVLRPVNL